MNKFLKVSGVIIGLIIAIAVYYNLVTLPAHQQAQKEMEQMFAQQQQQANDTDRNSCIRQAEADYLYEWNKDCVAVGNASGDPLYATDKMCLILGPQISASLEQHLTDDKNNCFKRYPISNQ